MKTIEVARQRAVDAGNPTTGLPWGEVCVRGILSGQWDGGKYVQRELDALEAEGVDELDDNG